MPCPICNQVFCDHTPQERGQTQAEMMADTYGFTGQQRTEFIKTVEEADRSVLSTLPPKARAQVLEDTEISQTPRNELEDEVRQSRRSKARKMNRKPRHEITTMDD